MIYRYSDKDGSEIAYHNTFVLDNDLGHVLSMLMYHDVFIQVLDEKNILLSEDADVMLCISDNEYYLTTTDYGDTDIDTKSVSEKILNIEDLPQILKKVWGEDYLYGRIHGDYIEQLNILKEYNYNYTDLIYIYRVESWELMSFIPFTKDNQHLSLSYWFAPEPIQKQYFLTIISESNGIKSYKIAGVSVDWAVRNKGLILNPPDKKESAPYKTYLMIDLNTNLYKIGRSRKPEYRERTLQSEKPTIKLLCVIDSDIETELHNKFQSKRIRGEWFNLTKEDVLYIKSQKK